MNIVKKISTAILKYSDGTTLSQSNKPAGGQEVPHIHFHIIPRNKGDKKIIWPSTRKYKEGEAEQLQNKIKSLLK
jgi:diadenosine tetraphosphate (Ap4A) HIT family hydrolase